jgi:glycosyltransferase involved in cell wall biosynthesis
MGGHPAHPFAPSLAGALARANIIHTHHLYSLPGRLAALIGRSRGVTMATTDHGLQGSTWFGLTRRLFDLFLTVSAYSARALDAPAGRTRVIYGGADPVRYTRDPRIERHGVLFVGRLTPHKGVDRLLQALPDGAALRIVGSTGHDRRLPERDYPNMLRHLAHDREVEFLGPLPDADLPAVYRSAKVLALPSVEETCYGASVRISELLGLAALEAMASGTPVIASRIGGLPEIVRDGETGFLVTPGDVDALHERLSQALADAPLARRLGDNGRQDVLERFTWARVAERCLDAYATTDARPGGRPAAR